MKTNQQRRAIAIHLGWACQQLPFNGSEPLGWPPGIANHRRHLQVLPYWPSDLNAMHSLEQQLTTPQRFRYVHELYRLTGDPGGDLMNQRSLVVIAAADLRCNAMLKTLELWKD